MTVPTMEPEVVLGGNLPELNLGDPAQLEAFYGNFAFFDHYRKSVLAQCRELVRAKFVGEKITEARLDDLARLHPNYLDFLGEHFVGRHEREKNIRESLGGFPR
jgi:hypothetical protein